MNEVEPLPAGYAIPTEGVYMVFEFDPHKASLTRVGHIYSSGGFNRRQALEAAQAAAEERASRGQIHQYVVALVTPEGGFRPVG